MTTALTPSPAQLRAAVDVLTRAWFPKLPTPTDDVDDTNGCGCGGSRYDDDGEPYDDDEPYCNCADGCCCRTCNHFARARAKVCYLHRCEQPTRYAITPWCVHRAGVTRSADADDPHAERGLVRLGDNRQNHPRIMACSTHHARELIDADRQRRTAYPVDCALAAERTFYKVEQWTYEPDDVDVPGPLSTIPVWLDSARYRAGEAIKDRYRRATGQAGHGYEHLDGVRQDLVRTLHALLAHDEEMARNADDE